MCYKKKKSHIFVSYVADAEVKKNDSLMSCSQIKIYFILYKTCLDLLKSVEELNRSPELIVCKVEQGRGQKKL